MRARLLAGSMITTAALAAAAGAHAQAPATAASTTTSEVVVTGTRLRSPNLTATSPVTALSVQDFALTGATDTIDTLNQLPQVSVGNGLNNTPNPLSGSGGFTTVDLRNLGTVRTLVLEDGRRLMPGDPTLGGEAADLDTIPTALIERVDVVTGGASAVYGSDAIAGVVNFIMKHNFQGVQVDAQYGVNEHDNNNTQMQGLEKAFGSSAPSGTIWDGTTWTTSIAVGSNTPDDKGNVTAYATYRNQTPVLQGARDYSACQVSQMANAPVCTGSSNSNFFKDTGSGLTYSVAGNSFVSGAARTQLLTPPKSFNSNPFEYLSRGDERYNGGYFAHYEAAPWADIYSDFSFMDDRSRIHAAPSALFQQTFNVNCANPLLSAQQAGLLTSDVQAVDGAGNPVVDKNGDPVFAKCSAANAAAGQSTLSIGRRDIEGGPRDYTFEHLSYKIDIGSRGDLGDSWHYDAYAQFGRTQYNQAVGNDLSLSKIQDALLVGGTPGNPACLSGNAGCVPYNIFKDGGVSPAALAYILTNGTSTGDTQEQIVSGNLSGDLTKWGLKSPFASTGVSLNLGAEYRREQLDQVPDETSLSGDLAGAGGALPPVHGAFDVKEAFGEIGIPLVQDMPFVKDLTFEGGYRFSSYNLAGNTNTYKFALNYAPDSMVRFRGSFQHAVRAPNVNELFTPHQITNTSIVSDDPCSADNSGHAATATLAQCMRTAGQFITAAQLAALYGDGKDPLVGGTDKISQCPAGQCGIVQGGNLDLKPEDSDTYSGGVVITPSQFIPGLSLSIDYFNINVKNAITPEPINIAFNNCLNSSLQCNYVSRQSNGNLFGSDILTGGYVLGLNQNLSSLSTEGTDFAVDYRFDLDRLGLKDKGMLTFRFDGTWTTHLDTVVPGDGGGSYNCAAKYGNVCGNPVPNWRHTFRANWITPWNVTASVQWRYFGGSTYDGNETNNHLLYEGPFDASGTQLLDTNDGKIGAYSYVDLSFTWKVKPQLMMRMGVNNIADLNPPLLDPLVTGSGTPNTYNSYDLLGRQIFVGLTANF